MDDRLTEVEARLLAGFGEVITECDQIIADVTYWNTSHPDDRPVMPDDIPVVYQRRREARRAIEAIKAGKSLEHFIEPQEGDYPNADG